MYENYEPCFIQLQSIGLPTPLYSAVQAKNARLVKLLLEHGADLTVVDTIGRLAQLEI